MGQGKHRNVKGMGRFDQEVAIVQLKDGRYAVVETALIFDLESAAEKAARYKVDQLHQERLSMSKDYISARRFLDFIKEFHDEYSSHVKSKRPR